MLLDFMTGTLEQGLIYALMVLGVFISFRILDYADLSVDGTLPMGAAIAAVVIFNGGSPWLATVLALVGGILAGMGTGFLHTHLKITPLLSGILMMTALYSVNLRIMGKANIPLLRKETIFSQFDYWTQGYGVLLLTTAVVILVLLILYLFLETDLGLALQATGDNQQMITSQGVNTKTMKILGLGISNGLVALSGAFVAQNQHSADIGMGIGTIIAGLASVIIGEVLFGKQSVFRSLIAVTAGSLVYRLVIAVVLRLGLPATDLKLMTALIVILALSSPILKSGVKTAKSEKDDSYAIAKKDSENI